MKIKYKIYVKGDTFTCYTMKETKTLLKKILVGYGVSECFKGTAYKVVKITEFKDGYRAEILTKKLERYLGE